MDLCPHYKTHCTQEYYGNYEDSGIVWSLICNECGETLRSEGIPSWEYAEQPPEWCWDAEDEDWYPARNPLKKSAFESKLKKLKKLGLEADIAEEIRNDFNSEYNDSSHSLYIIDWWIARLSLLKFLENEKNEYVSDLARYSNRYKIDAHDLSLDDVLQIDHYTSLRHYAHLAQTNPYFRLPWPHLHRITYQEGTRYDHRTHKYVPKIVSMVGEVRAWDSKLRSGEPAIKILTGANRAVSESINTRIEKSKISSTEETSDPTALIAFLKEVEDNIETSRFFEPIHHESSTLISFPDGKAWVVIREDDVRAEGSSLRDCATAENKNTILLSLREPVTKTHVQALLKAEIVFPKLSKEPSLKEIKENKGIIVQLRGYRNSKPLPEMHPYILSLLKQKWIVHLITPDYQSSNTFMLGDLEPEMYQPLRKRKGILFRPKTFYDKYKSLTYPHRIKERILEKIDMPVSEILDIISAKRYNLVMRRKALAEFKKRLNRGTKHMRGKLLSAAETLLFVTKNKSLINDIFDLFNGHKKQSGLFIRFFQERYDWLLKEHNKTFFLNLIEASLPAGMGRGYYSGKRLPKDLLKVLEAIKLEHVDFIIRLIYATRFDDSSMRNIRQLLESVLDAIIEDPNKLTRDICSWYQSEGTGWGRSEHRSFVNKVPLSKKLLRQFKRLIEISLDRGDDCYMDLAISIAAQMSSEDRDKLQPLAILLTKALASGNRRLRRETYEHLGRIVNFRRS